MEKLDLQHKARMAKVRLKTGQITLEEARKNAQPYINFVNAKAKELAKEYGVKPRYVSLTSFLR